MTRFILLIADVYGTFAILLVARPGDRLCCEAGAIWNDCGKLIVVITTTNSKRFTHFN
jgi:hypothetical protein